MKYIIITDEIGVEFPVFCLAPQSHQELATAWRRNDSLRVVSAGFVEFAADGSATVFGRSTGLNLGPRPQDARIISTFYHLTLKTAHRADQR